MATQGPPSALIASARGEGGAALATLLDSARGLLHVLADASLPAGVRGKVDAADVVQDTIAKAHARFGQFRGETEAEWVAWLKRILSRTLVDLHRRYVGAEGRDVARERSLEADVDRSAERLRGMLADDGTSPSGRASRREDEGALADALARLSPADREVVVLRSLRGLSWGEAARLTGRTPDALRVRWARALERLGRVLGGPG